MSAMLEELHQLADELPEAEFRPALEVIRGRAFTRYLDGWPTG
jgi:hypothetical protein